MTLRQSPREDPLVAPPPRTTRAGWRTCGLAVLLAFGFIATEGLGSMQAVEPPVIGSVNDSVIGIVQERGTGVGITGVRVELRGPEGNVLRATFSEPGGRFRLDLPASVLPEQRARLRLRAERLGYAPLEAPLSELAPGLVGGGGGAPIVRLQLAPAPIPLPALEVQVTPEPCPTRSNADAVRLWTAMAARHPGGLDTVGVATYTLIQTDTLAGVSTILSVGSKLEAGQRASAGRLRDAWERRLPRDGYAFPVRRTDEAGSYDAWSYAPLEADFASHFQSAAFASNQRFRAPVLRSEGGWDLPFCAPNARRPGLDGVLELSADTLLLRAEWRFRTPEPHEDAGGWARFPEASPGEPIPFLLPFESLVWRRIRSGAVQRRAQWYEAWVLTPGDSVPFLPARDPVEFPVPCR
jgi:hypothetical protein